MNISISNIAWEVHNDETVFRYMREHGFSGLEIAPTRIIPHAPYDHIREAIAFRKRIQKEFGFAVSSMQSIWYGMTEKLFGTDSERIRLIEYTKKAIDFAEALECQNLVFGCPKNRTIPDNADVDIAILFFQELGDYAYTHNTVVAMEPNPPLYHTNYINTTAEALQLIRKVDSKGFRLNLDIGAVIENKESFSVLAGSENLINHVHISEPGLVPLRKRGLHQELAHLLRSFSYQKYISIETGKQDDMNLLNSMMEYVSLVFA